MGSSSKITPQTILVYVGHDLVGDGLMKLPFVRVLKANWPQAKITWCAGKGLSVYASSLCPLVAGLIDETLENAFVRSRLGNIFTRPLGGRSFDLVLDTGRRFLTSLAVRRVRHQRLVSGAAGFLLSDGRPAARTKPRAMLGQMLQLIEAAGGDPALATPPLLLSAEATQAAALLLPPGPTYIGLAPGAGNRAKCWPFENYCAVAQTLGDAVPVFILGLDEKDWIAAASTVPKARLPLQDAAAQGIAASPILTIALAQRLTASLANDSGGGHMLAAGDQPLVSLFGPTDPTKVAARPWRGGFAPGARHFTVLRAQDFGTDEMAAIPVAAVVAALQSSMSSAGPR
ncbi:MAG: lipopolysaccharide heptosyltransferase family protein [Alphaproteobacteria bacterium]|nr:lipopolysaccharide heptosyltransferase family protein [Alphaproteobacteria bacterium]